MTETTDIFDRQLAQGKHPKELLAKDGLLGQLTKALVERCLQAEMDDHLGYEKSERAGNSGENRRNGYSKKRVISDQGGQYFDSFR